MAESVSTSAPDNVQPDSDGAAAAAGGPRFHAASAGIGVGVGAVGSTTLFTSLGLQKIMASPTGYSVSYPIALFCLISIFTIVTTMAVRQLTPMQAKLSLIGVAFFGLIVLLCVAEVGATSYLRPTVLVTERVQPDMSNFRDPDAKHPINLVVKYLPPGALKPVPLPGQHALRSNDTVDIVFDGVSELAEKYVSLSNQNQGLREYLKVACEKAEKDVCLMMRAGMDAST